MDTYDAGYTIVTAVLNILAVVAGLGLLVLVVRLAQKAYRRATGRHPDRFEPDWMKKEPPTDGPVQG
jgi:hypothetical protein